MTSGPSVISSVADPRGRQGRPRGVQIISISYSFWEILAKLYVGVPLHPSPGGLAPPPRENSRSTTAGGPGKPVSNLFT